MASPLFLPDDASQLGDAERVVAIGNFDGVHRGHQAVIAEAAGEARARGIEPSALTFDPHPLQIVSPKDHRPPPPPLMTLERRAELLGLAGAERVLVRRFDPEFAAWSPERFARDLLASRLRAKLVLVGANFRFGAHAAGELPLLASLGAELGFEVRVHPIAGDERGPFSSTRVRAAVTEGDVTEAQRVLGRWHSISGVVVHGNALGRTLGYPTANLDPVAELLPADGIYACVVDELLEGDRPRALAVGAMSIGVRPTVGGNLGRTVEVYLLDFARDLYGATLRVHVVARLRDELRFDSLAALKVRMARDVAETRGATAGIAPGPSGAYG